MQKTQKTPQSKWERNVDLAVRSVDEATRTIELSFSSEQPYQRWFGSEILSHDDGAADLKRLQDIGVLLFNHNRDCVLGKVLNVSLKDGRGIANAQFDEDEAAEVMFQKVKSGTLKGVSVGYMVDIWEEVAAGAKSTNGKFAGPCSIATKWTPYEISIVSVPADDGVGVGRDLNDDENKNNEIKKEENTHMENTEKVITEVKGITEAEVTAQKEAAITAERSRVSDITSLCREFEVKPDTFILEGKTADNVRTAILDEMKEKNKATKSGVNVTVVKDEMDKFKAAAADAILLKGGIKVEKPADGATQLRTASMIDIARECLNLEGRGSETRTLDKETLLRAALGGGQFSGILDSTVNKSMQTAYAEAQTTYQLWTSRGSNPDFKATNRYQISEGGELLKINENGEFIDDKMTDSGVESKVVTYGRKFSLTRQAIINDDLSYLTKMPQAYARAARRGINKAVYAILNTNPVIYDGYTLFNVANHANWIASGGAAPSVVQLGLMQGLMMKQKNLRGEEVLNIRPRFVVVPVELDVATRQLLTSANDPSLSVNPNTTNPFNGRLDVISDAELTDGVAWFTIADPSTIDTIEVTYLNGQDMPTLESQISWDTLGMEFRIYIDYGITVIDYRGFAKNKGAA